MIVGHWNMAPSEFWAMSPQEAWLLIDERKPPEKVGNMLKSDFDSLSKELKDAKSRYANHSSEA